MTLAKAKSIAKIHGFTLRHLDGEYRVNLINGASEATAYYTNDRDDAVDTGIAMVEYQRVATLKK